MRNNITLDSFVAPELKRQQNLGYYGEFLVDLAFDDGYITALYPVFLSYLESLDLEGATFSHSMIENIRAHIKLIIEVPSLGEKKFQEELYGHILTLQSQYLFSPIIQHVGHKIDTGIELPFTVDNPTESEAHFGRFEVQKAHTKLLVLQKDRARIEYLTSKLKDVDDERIQVLLSDQLKILTFLQEQETDCELEIQELTAAQYLRTASRGILHENTEVIPREQATIMSDIGQSADPTHRIQEWMKPITAERGKLEETVSGLSKKIAQFTEIISSGSVISSGALESLAPREGLLCDVTTGKSGRIIKASLFGTPFTVASNGEKLEGFKLEGISNIKSVIPNTTNEAGILDSFFVYPGDFKGKRFYYLNDEKYIYITIDGESEIREDITSISLSDDGSVNTQILKIKGSRFYVVFKTGEHTFESLKNNNEIISFHDSQPGGAPISDDRIEGDMRQGRIKVNESESLHYFSDKNKQTYLLEIEGVKRIVSVDNLLCDKDGVIHSGTVRILGEHIERDRKNAFAEERMFKKEGDRYVFVSFTEQKNNLIQKCVGKNNEVIAGVMKNGSDDYFVFETYDNLQGIVPKDSDSLFKIITEVKFDKNGTVIQGIFHDGKQIHVIQGKNGSIKSKHISFRSPPQRVDKIGALSTQLDVLIVGEGYDKKLYYYQAGRYQELSITLGTFRRKHNSFYSFDIDVEALEGGVLKGRVMLKLGGGKIPFEKIILG